MGWLSFIIGIACVHFYQLRLRGSYMKRLLSVLFVSFLVSTQALALDVVETLYAEKIVHGGPSTVRDTASSLSAVEGLDSQLYDIAAEVLLRDYKSATSNTSIDAMAWITKALVASGDAKYLPVLAEVRDNASHKKLKKHASTSHRNLRKNSSQSSPAYQQGMVDLTTIKRGSIKGKGKQGLEIIKVGMGAGEVYDLVGTPTSERGNVTGQAWNPFNFSGRGSMRITAYFKGKGSIVFENTSKYSGGRRVVDVIIDPYESGAR